MKMIKDITIDEAIRENALINFPDIEKVIKVKINAEAEKIYYFLERIGGENGWFSYDSSDLIKNLEKGRVYLKENFSKICPKGKIDLFQIEDYEPNKKLQLKFESKLAEGENSFFIRKDIDGKQELVHVFRIKLKNFWGRLYWKLQMPFDGKIRSKMLANIKKMAEAFQN